MQVLYQLSYGPSVTAEPGGLSQGEHWRLLRPVGPCSSESILQRE
jgi:hypothetical protein